MKKDCVIIIIIFVCLGLFDLSALSAKDTPAKRYAGLFGTSGVQIPLQKRLSAYEKAFQDEPWLNGMLVIVGWKSLEPEQGRFDWSEVDKQVDLAAKFNRKVSLLFVPMLAPDWVYKQGVRKFTFTDPNPFHRRSYGKVMTVPWPFSKQFYKLWSGFIAQAGKRYDQNPTVVAVVIMGVNFTSSETYIRVVGREQMESSGVTPDDIVACWKKYIDVYMQSFPNTMCCMHLGEMLGYDHSVLNKVVAYGADHYPNHFQIQTDKLCGRSDLEGEHEYDLVREYSSRIAVGFQDLAAFSRGDPGRQGSMLMTLMNGIRAHAGYYELWFGDATDPETSKAFYDQLQQGKKIGWEALIKEAKSRGEYKTIGQDHYYARHWMNHS